MLTDNEVVSTLFKVTDAFAAALVETSEKLSPDESARVIALALSVTDTLPEVFTLKRPELVFAIEKSPLLESRVREEESISVPVV